MYFLHLIAFKFPNNFWTNYSHPASPGSNKGVGRGAAINGEEYSPDSNINVLVSLSLFVWRHRHEN